MQQSANSENKLEILASEIGESRLFTNKSLKIHYYIF